MAQLFFNPYVPAFSLNGVMVPGAKAFFYLTGTTTPAAVYTTDAMTTAHAHPVVAGADGKFADIYMDPAVTYKVVLNDAAGVLIRQTDPYRSPSEIQTIGLKTASSGIVVNAGTTRLQTSGYNAVAKGAGQYVHTPTFSFGRTGSITIGAAIVTGLQQTNDLHTGAAVTGQYIPAGTTILSIDSSTQITLSANATDATATGSQSVSFTIAVSMTRDEWGTVWPRAGIEAADGRWFRLDTVDSRITMQQFGVVGDQVTDDVVAAQAFFDFVVNFSCADVWLHGSAWLGSMLYIGKVSGSSATKVFYGGQAIFTVLSGSSFVKLVTMRNMTDSDWHGRIIFRGNQSTSGGDYADRTVVGLGLWLDACRGAHFRDLWFQWFWYGGWATQSRNLANTANSNNSLITIDKSLFQYVGSGDREVSGSSLQAAWTSAASPARDSGAGSSTAQRTSITVTNVANLPPAAIIGAAYSDLGTAFTNQTVIAFIDGYSRRVTSMDWATGVVEVYPWLPSSAATSGTLTWAFGGAGVLHGIDCNNWKIGMMDGRQTAIGIALRCNQGPEIGVLSMQGSLGIGILLGDGNALSNKTANGTVIQHLYLEGADHHILNVADFDDRFNSGRIVSNPTHFWSEAGGTSYLTIHAPLDASYVSTDTTFRQWIIEVDGVEHWYKPRSTSGGALGLENPVEVVIVRSDSTTINLSTDSRIKALFNYDRAVMVVLGTGTNGAPTGTIGLTVDTGASLNGVVNGTASYSGASGPLVIGLYEGTLDVWESSLISGKMGIFGTATSINPASLIAGAKTAISTMTVTGAVAGDVALMSFSNSLAGARISGWGSATDVVSYYFVNENGTDPLDLASGTVTARIVR